MTTSSKGGAANATNCVPVLRVAASLEQNSEHPLARAIVDQAKEAGLVLVSPIIAGSAMSFSSLSVVANALRLRTVGIEPKEGE